MRLHSLSLTFDCRYRSSIQFLHVAQINAKQHFQVRLAVVNASPHLTSSDCRFAASQGGDVSSRRGRGHAFPVHHRAENQAADGGKQRFRLSPPPSPLLLHQGRRDGAISSAVTDRPQALSFFLKLRPVAKIILRLQESHKLNSYLREKNFFFF